MPMLSTGKTVLHQGNENTVSRRNYVLSTGKTVLHQGNKNTVSRRNYVCARV